MTEDSPILDTLTDMTAASLSRTSLDGRELMLVRLGALAAMNAPVSSYFLNMGVALREGLTAEDAQGALVAVAPIIGAPRTVAAAAAIAEAIGIAIAIDDAIAEMQSSD